MKKQSSFSSSFEQKEKGKVLALWAENTDLCELSFWRVEISHEDRTSRSSASQLTGGTSRFCETDFHP